MNLALPLIAALLLQAAPAPSPEPQTTPKPVPVGPTVVLETTLGTVKLVLDKEKAPISVDNFLKYVRARYYDGTIFHRVIPSFMAQGGGMDAQLVEKLVRAPIRNEASNGLHNARGTIAMARTNDANSATAQFYINVHDNFKLDYGMTGAGYAVLASDHRGHGPHCATADLGFMR
jgi:peptidyl-prolyl cis-trans isomerase A (cyclophilin A)